MKKHLLRILTVLMSVCFGACLLAACGGNETNGDNNGDNGGAQTPATYTVTYADGIDGAEVTVPTDTTAYQEGATVTVKAGIEYTGKTFKGWSNGTDTYQPNETFKMPAHDVTLTAQWETASTTPKAKHRVTLTYTETTGITVTLDPALPTDGMVEEGTTLTLTVAIESGTNKAVDKVTANNTAVTAEADGSYKITISAETAIAVTFKDTTPTPPPATTYTVTYSFGEGTANHAAENATPPTQEPVVAGTSVTLKAAPAAATGWEFDRWEVKKADGTEVNVSGNAFTMPESNVTVTALWKSTSTPATSIENVWEKANGALPTFLADVLPAGSLNYEVSVELAEGEQSGYAVILMSGSYQDGDPQETVSFTYTLGFALTKSGDDFTSSVKWPSGGSGQMTTITITYAVANDKLTITGLASEALVLDKSGALGTAISPSGVRYSGEDGYEIDFTAHTLKVEGVAMANSTFANVGKYVLICYTVEGADASLVVFAENDSYYYYSGEGEKIELTSEKPAPTYTVEFVQGDHGNISGETTVTGKKAGETVAPPTVTPSAGYVFAGWYNGDEKVVEPTAENYPVNAEHAEGGTITLTAHYTAKTYTVTLVAGENGTLSENTVEATYDAALDLSGKTPTAHKGYTFDAWYTAETDGVKFDSGDTWQTDGTELKLYAHYNYIEYTVVYAEGDKGTGNVTLPTAPTGTVSLKADNNTITLSEPTYDGTDKKFAGWDLNGHSIGTTGAYTLNAEHLPENTAEHKLTITATWSDVGKVRVSYELGAHHADGATVDPAYVEVEENGTVTLPDAPQAATGYEFDAWYVKVTNEADSTVKAGDAKGTYTVGKDAVALIGKYKAIVYTVKYVLNKPKDAQGTLDPESIVDGSISMESALTLPADPSGLTNYLFAGWTATGIGDPVKNSGSDELTLTAEIIAGATAKKEITLTAEWTKLYGVTYDDGVDEAEITVPTDSKLYAAGEDVTLQAPDADARKGYEFNGWKVNGAGDPQKSGTVAMTEGGLTLTAQWTPKTYTITLNVDEPKTSLGTIEGDYQAHLTQTVSLESTTITLPTLSLKGYTFGGWLKGSELFTATTFTAELIPAEGDTIALTAKWTVIDYTITFAEGKPDGAGSVTGMPSESKTVSATNTEVELEAPELAGYRFDGWKLDETHTFKEDGSTKKITFTLTAELIGTLQGGSTTFTLTAQWVKTYTVTYEKGDHAAEGATVPEAQTVDENKEIQLPEAPAAAEGYVFTGWKINDETELKQLNASVTITKNTTITAQWEPKPTEHGVTYKGEDSWWDNEVPPDSETHVKGDIVTIDSEIPDRAGYTFAGWEVKTASGQDVTLENEGKQFKMPDEDVTITPKWTPIKPTITFDKGDAQGADPELKVTDEQFNGEHFTLKLPESTYTAPTGKYFRGWEIDEVVYFPGEQYDAEVNSQVTIKAVWENLFENFVAEDASLIGIKWGAGRNYTIYEGHSLELVAEMKDTAAEFWHGLINDGLIPVAADGKDYFAHFRVDGFVWTTGDNAGDSNTTDALKVMDSAETSWSPTWDSVGYTALYAATATVYHVINVSLAEDVLTYKYSIYSKYTTAEAADNEEFTHTTWKVNLKEGTTQLSMAFLIDCGHTADGAGNAMTTENAKVAGQLVISEKQNLTEENSLTITGGWTREAWSTKICKGETMELKGKAALTAADTISGWHGFVSGLYFDGVVPNVMRMDNWLGGMDKAAPQTANGVNYAYDTAGNVATSTLTKNQQYDTSIKVDWSNVAQIVVTMKIGTAVTTWTITAESGSLAESYLFSIGVDTCTATFTSITRTHATV